MMNNTTKRLAWVSMVSGLLILGIALASTFSHAQLPDKAKTPGSVRTTSAAEICAASFRTGPYRKTTQAMKRHVCAEYGVKKCPLQNVMEIDHLLPLELGGLDDEKNLWVQLAEYPDGSPGYHAKDELENELKRRVCKTKEMTLSEAQACIMGNWIKCRDKVFQKSKK